MTERAAVVLAAGEGTRMKSSLPKVLHDLEGKPLLAWVLDAVVDAGFERTIVVVGHGGDRVREEMAGRDVEFVWQRERKGTGHAVMQAMPSLEGFEGTVAVLSGDVPLVRAATMRAMAERHEGEGAAATLVTVRVEDPTGYGRIVRDGAGRVARIVEQKDADEGERRIDEINAGTYCFRAAPLFETLPKLGADNAGGEYYLTDTIGAFVERGLPVLPFPVEDGWEFFGINTREHLRLAALRLRESSDG
ncbi:MAG: NTP transferase domain-containing protein [Candidatus Eisenbacteria bacterium]|nr:NTP transferase domain-containing protein [Candidatus Eisenbacteria bacterium]